MNAEQAAERIRQAVAGKTVTRGTVAVERKPFDRPTYPATVKRVDPEAVERERQLQVASKLARARLPEIHKRRALSGEYVEHAEWRALHDRLRDRCTHGLFVLLIGPNGTGKTQLAVSLAVAMCLENRESRYVKGDGYCDLIRQSFNRDPGERDKPSAESIRRHFAQEIGFLVIDEADVRTDSEFGAAEVQRLLDKRYESMRDTVMIANATPQTVTGAFGRYLIDRLNERDRVLVMDWKSFRG